MPSLFDANPQQPAHSNSYHDRPLADILRPQNIDAVIGQDHIIGQEGRLRHFLDQKKLPSLIFWGPPGCGKTTIARLLADHVDGYFQQISAIFSGVSDLKKIFQEARIRAQNGQKTILFVDEIHRFNKSQQDAFLPVIENGTITLIGATTENPSFELNNALLSRCQVFILNRLDDAALEQLIVRTQAYYDRAIPLDDAARSLLKSMADGDGRYLLTMAETIFLQEKILDQTALKLLLQKRAASYDKKDDQHYSLISALHKSVRGSDVDGALYWFARMLHGGEDPLYIARRMIRMAVEDIGLADPQALPQTIAAAETYERLGSPEGELALTQALIYLATAPKSNAVYTAYKAAIKSAKENGSLMPPAHILNAPTSLMKDQGYGAGYEYDHDAPDGFSGQNYFPDAMPRQSYYTPVERGFERDIQKRLAYWQKLRDQRKT